MKALALIDDIFFLAKIQETAKALGVELRSVTGADQFVAEAQGTSPALLLVDLNARQDAVGAVERLRAGGSTARVVAFLSHVQVDLAERAKAAGCTEVMPRSKFTMQLAQILGAANS